MPTAHQRTVDIKSTERSLGISPANVSTSDTRALAAAYPASPIHRGDLTPDERRKAYMDLSLSAVVNDEGHTFNTVGTDYKLAPDMKEVDLDKHNLPSPYVPNPASPGPGSQNDVDKPKPPEGFGQTPSQTYGSGVGSRLSPKASSERTAKQTLGQYILGKSSSDSEV